MPRTRTRFLLLAATVVTGVLAGGVVDRVIVGGPAWHELGTYAWMQYSRRADLGGGLVVYPLEGRHRPKFRNASDDIHPLETDTTCQ